MAPATITQRWQWVPRAAAVIAAGLLLLGLFIISQTEGAFREQKASEARVQAEILAASVTAALDFHDSEAARETVGALRANPQIRVAGVYDANGLLFAGYSRTADPLPRQLPSNRSISGDGTQQIAAVMRGGTRIGTAYLESDFEPISRRLARYGLMTLLAVMASLVVIVLGLAQSALRRANRELTDANAELLLQIDEREKAESQLRQVQKMESIGQLTGGIAHDFNNMLAIVIGNLDIAQRRFTTAPDKALAAVRHAMEGADRAATLTRRLLAFSRQQPLEPQTLDINKLVGGMSELLHRALGEQIRVETVLAGGLWRTHADPSQLENAILNLSVNARDAMENGGKLTIETLNAYLDDDYARRHEGTAAGQYVAVAVSDTGSGMSRGVLDKAFEPFFTTKGVGKGTGLGLSQIYGFVRQSGGHVKIYSEVGQGTTVKIYLPRLFADDQPLPQESAAIVETPHGHADELVLVVEDEEEVRRMSVATLRELGYTVIEAAGGAEALRSLATHPEVRLLFTDVVMPDMNGRELADVAREEHPDLLVVYTTGYTRNAIVHNGVLDAGVDFIPKPFTVDQLARKIRAVFDGPANIRSASDAGSRDMDDSRADLTGNNST